MEEYTHHRVRAFSEAIDRSRRRQHIELALIIRAASNLDAEAFAEFLNPTE